MKKNLSKGFSTWHRINMMKHFGVKLFKCSEVYTEIALRGAFRRPPWLHSPQYGLFEGQTRQKRFIIKTYTQLYFGFRERTFIKNTLPLRTGGEKVAEMFNVVTTMANVSALRESWRDLSAALKLVQIADWSIHASVENWNIKKGAAWLIYYPWCSVLTLAKGG